MADDAELDDDDDAWAIKFWKGPILLMHGRGDSADDWIRQNSSPRQNLPFLLADIGYEVWVCNNRGTYNYSSHETLKPQTDEKFWDFHWIDQGRDDLSSLVQQVYKQ